jgi:uncharacterized protein
MVLEGVVTNVAAFGAFVDVGVHQDGLVHVSAMSRDFVSDPRQVAKPGDVVRVRVLSVDIPRQRIGLSMRLDDEPGGQTGRDRPRRDQPGRDRPSPDQAGRDRPRRDQPDRDRPGRDQPDRDRPGRDEPPAGGAMADALRRAGLAGGPAGETPARETRDRRSR